MFTFARQDSLSRCMSRKIGRPPPGSRDAGPITRPRRAPYAVQWNVTDTEMQQGSTTRTQGWWRRSILTRVQRQLQLTAYDDDDNLFAALKTGAIGYVLKDATPEELTAAIHAAHQGQGFLSPALVARVVREFARTDRLARGQRALFAQLTRREMEVLELLAAGPHGTHRRPPWARPGRHGSRHLARDAVTPERRRGGPRHGHAG